MRNDTLKAARLDFFLVRPYMKSFCVQLAIPVVFTAINRSLIIGISFAMCLTAMTAGYTFAVCEKSGMDRLYGILPVSKTRLVVGRYLYTFSMGLLAFVFSLLVHPLVLRMLGVSLSLAELCFGGAAGVLMFTLNTVFQLPGYYRFGSIKGRVFAFLPVIGFLAVQFVVSYLEQSHTGGRLLALLTFGSILNK